MAGDFAIFINGSEVENFTDARLSRSKNELTGTLTFSLFMSYVPGQPVMTNAIAGADIAVYIAGQIAMVGKVDVRRGTGALGGTDGTKNSDNSSGGNVSASSSIGPDEYTVNVTARGLTKMLIDSSHRHKTGTLLKPTDQDAINIALEGTGIQVEWLAEAQQLDKVRFRDGGLIMDEVSRLCQENAHFVYETRDGRLRVTDDTARQFGDPLILGYNIQRFSTEQSEDEQRSEIKVKGQRTDKEKWGEDAVINNESSYTDSSATNKAGIIVQHYGDSTPEALQRRAQFEANKRNSASKQCNIDLFGLEGFVAPFDIGLIHYVEVPCEDIFGPMECTGLTYSVDATKELKTSLTLSPLPTSGLQTGGGGAGSAGVLDGIEDLAGKGNARRTLAGVTSQVGFGAAYWSGPVLSATLPSASIFATGAAVLGLLDRIIEGDGDTLPKTLPPAVRNK